MKATSLLVPVGITLLLFSCGQPHSHPSNTSTSNARTQVPLLGTNHPNAIPGQYLIVLHDNQANTSLVAQSSDQFIQHLGLDPQGVQVQQVYSHLLKGFAAKLNSQNLAKLRQDPRIKYIEQDAEVRAFDMHNSISANISPLKKQVQQDPLNWGLDRIDQRQRPMDDKYYYNTRAEGVNIYIIDTGIDKEHQEFGNRVRWGINTSQDGQDIDCNGHGTHVAGIAAGKSFGVAKRAKLIAVKVLNCSGGGSYSSVIAGMEWTAITAQFDKGPSVANMSLGGRPSKTFDEAIAKAVKDRDLTIVTAAGNDSYDACLISPGRLPEVINVASTDRKDKRSGFSSYGKCVDLFAPGQDILSAWIGSPNATFTASGTSMAAPHVTGAIALMQTYYPLFSSKQVKQAIINNSTKDIVKDTENSPNRLLYTAP